MVSKEKIRKHKEQRRQLEQKRKRASALNTILSNLKEEYIRRKHTFPLVRYKKLKNMIKSAVAQFQGFCKKDDDRGSDSEESGGQSSPSLGLLENAKKLEKATKALREEKEFYSSLSSKDIDKELNEFAEKSVELDKQFQSSEGNIKSLGESYESSKSLMPLQRYRAMKSMIKTCLREASLL